MKTGMLWYDNDPKVDLMEKVNRASAYYAKKYGQSPNICFVHPSMVPEAANGNGRRGNVDVQPNLMIMPNHFWIGIHDGSRS